MAASSSSSFPSSSSSSEFSCQVRHHEFEEKYDVFLSFRGEDTRDTFASYLYGALSAKQILTFMDHKLERGDEISPTLRKAIQESKIWVVIFSENFASSTWCLDELVHILQCKKINEQGSVMPIFYGIDPSVVRKQEGSYGVAFAAHEKRFKDRMKKVHQWRAALTEASNLCGLDSKNFRPECKFVQRIVDDISLKLPKYLSNEHLYGHLIGIEKKIKEIELLLSTGSKDIRIVGIYGMGGIGKTTLASVVYQRLSYTHFEGCCFLWNVREEYTKHGPNHLREKLLSELLNDEAILKMDSPFVASPFILDRLRRKKVLIILDDVDSSIQLEALVQGYDWLAPSSRIIVTTRNVQVIKKVADRFYKVEGLSHNESLELFHLHAFGKNSSIMGYDQLLLERVARYANGNPLALKVLGSFLHSKSKEEWEIALNKLKIMPNQEIQDVLRISYEGLDDEGIKSTFLDIACLFGQSFTRDQAENMLEASDSFVKLGISVLMDRSLIENGVIKNELWMHDLIQQMGRTIVRDEHREPGNRSRLCDAKDICHVLERETGTATVECISLNMSTIDRDVKDDIKFKLYLPQGLDSYLSDKLNYFQWDLYPLKSLPSHFTLENLVELILRGSHLKKLWNHEVQSLPVLRRIDLSYSKLLSELPDLSVAPNLESINLESCTSLVRVLSSLQNLQRLTHLNLNGCSKLKDIKEISRSTGRFLDLERFGGIRNLLNNIGQQNFVFLKSFVQRFTGNLSLYSSQSHISEIKFPMSLSVLRLSGTVIEALPPSIEYIPGLVLLDLSDCTRLKSLPTNFCNLKSLEEVDLSGCLELDKFPEVFEPMEHLTYLNLRETGIKDLPKSIENLVSLQQLNMILCKNSGFLPNSRCNLRKLLLISLEWCPKLQKLPPLPPALIVVRLNNCESLKSLPELPSLCYSLYARFCTSPENISNWWSPLLHNVNIYNIGEQINFHDSEKLDQNTSDSIRDHAINQILFRLKFEGMDINFPLEIDSTTCEFRYPGDEIPEWFCYQSCETSINIRLPPYWNNENFLGLAFCIVLDRNKIDPGITLFIGSKISFKTIDDDHLCQQYCYTNLMDYEHSSDQVIMWYVKELNLRNSRLSWPSTCSTEASLHVWPEYIVSVNYNGGAVGGQYGEIRKFGVRFVYNEDIERFDRENKSKNKRRFDECCEASSGNEAFGSHDEEDHDESHSKKVKVM
ncbi:TMV resistance protein N-like [Ziziphus jujuba]|uniref:ADP-ribosyl cyclase/cyclic ADP-ribose hydrolase n=1 Tax=Ziziphus jujuba TaxID=326968 RepID=A0ABM4AB55_ZIZJJ|nr:TMV resistance protein N-like [Ziziphus jujuba]